MRLRYINSVITFTGVFGFLTIVTYLHIVQMQQGYNPIYQLMSELALGKQGSSMIFAFLFLSLATFGALKILSYYNAHIIIKIIICLSGVSFTEAGIFKLGSGTTDLHAKFIMGAFISIVLTMYLTPRFIKSFRSSSALIVCWGLGAGAALFVVLGNEFLPIGIAQRLAVTCILAWFLWLAVFDIRNKKIDI